MFIQENESPNVTENLQSDGAQHDPNSTAFKKERKPTLVELNSVNFMGLVEQRPVEMVKAEL